MINSMLKEDGIIICTAMPNIAVIIHSPSTVLFFLGLNFQNKAGNEASDIKKTKEIVLLQQVVSWIYSPSKFGRRKFVS
jgi:hypothetical protein